MGIPLAIIGLILKLVSHQYFSAQHQLGGILIWIGAGLIVLQLLWILILGGIIAKYSKL